MGDRRPNDDTSRARRSTPTIDSLREKYNIKDRYRKPASFSDEESRYGNGNYPPDWNKDRSDIDNAKGGRREAILEYQNYECGRCRADLRSGAHCHHYRPINEGGTHELQNLVALCIPCHKLIHPNVDKLDGDWQDAPLFPATDADPRVATIRKAVTPSERDRYLPELELLELTSAVGENTFATSDATYATSPTDAIEAVENLTDLLENVGLTPDQTLMIHVINAEHSPLRDANVELEIDLGDHGTYATEQITDKQGEAHFTIPEPERVCATVRKDDFEPTSIDVPMQSEPYETTVKLKLTGKGSATGATAAESAGDSGSSTSRRGVLTLAVGALGGLGVYRYLSATRNEESEDSGNEDRQTEDRMSEVSSAELTEGWNVDTGTSAAIQSIKTVGDRIYANTKTGAVISLSSTGSQQWTADLREKSTEPLTVVDDQIVVASQNQIQAFDADNGDSQWEFEAAASDEMPLITAGGDGIIAVLDNNDEEITEMISIDTASGDERWRTEIDSYRRPVGADDLICVPVGNYGIKIYNDSGEFDTGVEFPERPSRAGELTVVGNRGYILAGETSQFGYDKSIDLDMHAFDIQSKVHLWQTDSSGSDDAEVELPPPGVKDGQILHSVSSSINAFDDSGVASWDTSFEGDVTSIPVIEGERVYIGLDGTDQYSIQELDRSSGEILSETAIDQSVITGTVVDTNLIVGTSRGTIRAFGVSD